MNIVRIQLHSSQISIPNNSQLHCVSWMQNLGYVATGGTDGVLKVLKLAPSTHPRGSSGPTNLSVNQNLDGHSGIVQVAAWNEVYQKLTTSDSNGLIIVWLTQRDSWYEEMINNRNKSVVVDMAWSHNGTKIAIAYEDGQVIIGSVDGNRLWSKDITGELAAVCWSYDSSLLLFGMADGEVHVYDASGTFVQKVHMVCLENVELETALTKDLRRDTIISMQWYVAALASKIYDGRPNDAGAFGESSMNPATVGRITLEAATHPLFRGHIPEDRPRFLIAYKHGVVQLMRNENDAIQLSSVIFMFHNNTFSISRVFSGPIVIKLPNMILSKAKWSPDGSLLAICGLQTDLDVEKCVVHFVTAYGDRQRLLQIPGQTISDLTWEGGGLRICMAIDSHLFFANIRPNYTVFLCNVLVNLYRTYGNRCSFQWAYCGQTVVYSYERSEQNEHCVVFFETKLEECYQKYVKQLLHIAAFEDHCVVVNRADDQAGMYFMQICNGIGTPVDSKYIDLEPKFVAMNGSEVLVASADAFFLWRYVIPRSSRRESLPTSTNTSDLYVICMLLDCRESGSVQRYSLPQIILKNTFLLGCRVERMELNCNGTRLAVLTSQGMQLFEISETSTKMMNFDRKDVWCIKWDAEKDDTIAVMEKTRMYVVRNTECEEPIVNSGYLCSFHNLTVRTVLLDEIMKSPENPDKSYIVDVEIKSLRDAKNLLEKMKIQEATAFIEKNSHPKLWSLLAEVALSRLDTATAEHAYVMLKDYAGIQLIKRINGIQHEDFKRAEIAVFLGRLDEAEKIYMERDRRDLAIAMRRKMNDWFRIMEIVQRSSGPGDDQLLKQAWNHVGDYYADRQNWMQAAFYYEKCENYEQLIRCYLMNDNYEKLGNLSKQLPDGHDLLKMIGEIFGGAGLCEQAVNCYLRCDMLNDALDVCIQLNQWDKAVQLSKTHNLRNVDALLGKYAEQLTGSNEKTLAAVQLYRRAGKFLEAARIVFDIANEERKKQAQPLRLKKLYVLGALLVEQYHDQNKAEVAKDADNKSGAEVALRGLLEEDNALSLADTSLIDGAWRGAEAYHFYMLAQHQLYESTNAIGIFTINLLSTDYFIPDDVDASMKTALHLTDFDDILEPVEVYSLLALASCAARQFSVCSRAFIKLESLPSITPQEREAYSKLALTIFTKYPPNDTRLVQVECTGCDAHIPDYCQMCPNCDTKFPTCIVSGRPLLDYQFWLCPTCKHRAYEQQISSMRYCPLCHGEV
ncbi:unnamed protein product [Anisakis simplex]|uniref:WD_REPEATS_REGION domain-containing protein n=1 Tax=Anisakis simplex TaxID=6269 RepID=A0A158PPH5_ANISI|nr:unnamed protein product [Anisakis simplex]